MRLTKTPFSLCLAACFLSQAIPAWAAVKIMNYKDFSSKYGTAQVLDLALDSLGGPWCAVLDKATLNTGAGDIQDRGALLNYRSVGGGSWATVSLGKQDSPRLVSRAVAAGPGVTVWSAVGRTIRKVTQFEQYKYNLDEFDFSSTQGTVTVIPEDGSKTYDTTTSGLDFGACNDIAVDAAGNVWLACSGGIFLLDGSTRLGAALAGSGLSPWKQAVRVGDGYTSCIALDRSGGAYFGTRSSGVLKYDGQKWSQAAAPGAPVTAITVGPQGRLWFATAPVAGVMGIHQLENGALKSQNFTVGGADRWNEVSSMAFDNQGKLWVGTLGGGVKVYNGTAWTGYGTADGLASDVVNAVLVESADRVWFGTDEGVSLLLFTNSPDPARAADAHILKSAQLTDSAGVFFVGRLNGKFIAGMGPGFNNEVKWSFNTGGTILSSPAADRNGVLYFGSGDKKIYALYPNGQLKWSYETGGAVVSSPAVDVDGSVYVGSKDGYLYALTRSGALKWRFQTGAAIYASPALAQDGSVYIGSLDGKLYALGRDGELLWSFSTGDRIYSSAVIGYQNEIIFGSNDFSVYALNPDGSLKWSYATGGEVVASPAIDQDGTVYVPSNDWNFYAFQPDGTLKWSYLLQMPVWSSPTISMEGQILDGTCGAARQYASGFIPEGYYPLAGISLLQAFELKNTGDDISFTMSGGSGDEHGSYAEGYTGTFVTAVFGRSMMLADDLVNPGGGTTSNSPTHGFEGHTSWPRFRHDSRNTGNVNTSLEIPKFDLGFEVVYSTCDLDHDGAVTFLDAVRLMKGIQTGQYSFGMDRDNNGAVTMLDVIRFLLDMRDGTCNLGSPISLAAVENQKGLEEFQALATLNKAELEQALATMDLSDADRQEVEMMLNGLAPGAALPKAFSLAQNAPNPFNPSTTIAYEAPEGANQNVELSVFDVRGRKVRQLVDGMAEPGKHFAFFDGRDDLGRELPSGVYFYRLSAGSFSQTRKMILLK